MHYVCGIDPGVEGGAVILRILTSSIDFARQVSFSKNEEERYLQVATIFRDYFFRPQDLIIEKVSGYIGGLGQPGSKMFVFGDSFGSIKSAVRTHGGHWPIEVKPMEWQKKLGLSKKLPNGKKMDRDKWKTSLLKKAEELFPTIKFSKATADACLISYFGCLTQEER